MTDHDALDKVLAALPDFLTPEEIAELLRVDRKAVYRWLDKGDLRGYKAEQKWRIARGDFERWLKLNSNASRSRNVATTPIPPDSSQTTPR